jgi:hypothetical protein
MGTLPPEEAGRVDQDHARCGHGGRSALKEPVDVHLGLGFPLRLYPLGGIKREPSFAAFPFKSSFNEMLTEIRAGTDGHV